MYNDYENVPRKRLSVGLTPTTMEHLEVVCEDFRAKRLDKDQASCYSFKNIIYQKECFFIILVKERVCK